MSLIAMTATGQEVDTLSINEVTVVPFYRNSIDKGKYKGWAPYKQFDAELAEALRKKDLIKNDGEK